MSRRTAAAAVLLLLAAAPLAAQREIVFDASAGWRDGSPPAGGSAVAVVRVAVESGWHVNSNAPLDEYLVPTEVRLELPAGWTADAPLFPAHRLASFAFSDGQVAVFEGEFDIELTVHRPAGAGPAPPIRGVVEAQACNDSSCLPPAEGAFSIDPAPESRVSRVAGAAAAGGLSGTFLGGSLLVQIGLVFLAGLALNLTPCVYPLIPITVGFFSAQRESGRRAWLLAVLYVLGMSVTYSALGVTAALTGQLFGSALQSPILVGVVVAILLALAASMFGAWELRVPGFVTRMSGGRPGALGAVLMGLVVGFVAAPCIGPFVLGLLTYVGRQGDPLLGFVLFFVLALGLGVPYLVLGVSTRAIEKLPNSGAWMLGVRQVFGVLLVALAGFFARPFVPQPWGDWLFAGLLIAGGAYLLLIARPAHEQPIIDRVMRAASAAILLAGVILLPGRPQAGSAELEWLPYEERSVAAALASGQPVVLDFYADWCLPCKELDEKTFSDTRVADRLGSYARFKVDLTSPDEATEALQRRYGVLGVPTIAFFQGGAEVESARLTGFERPEAFLDRLDRVQQGAVTSATQE